MEASPFSFSKPAALRFAVPAAFALLVAIAYADPLFSSRTFVGRDLLPYGFPTEKATHDAWARGRLPVWNDDVSGGRPLMPNPNTGVLYPLRPLLSRFPFPAAMRLMPVVHWVVAGCGMIALLSALGASPAAGWVAAGTYAFSGVLVSEVFYIPLQAGAALQPWALWALARPAAGSGRRVLGIGVVYGLMALAGDAVSVGLALLAAVLWILLELSGNARRRAAAALGLGLALAVFVAAPQIGATAGLVPQTRRAVTGISLGESLTYSLPPWRLLELAVPYPFGETWTLDPSRNWGAGVARGFFASLHCGAFALLALVAGRGRRGARFCLVLAAASAGLAAVGFLASAAVRSLASPLPLRYPEKLVVGLTLALALQAGLSFDSIAAAPRRAARLALGAAGILALSAAAAASFPGAVRRAALAAGAGNASSGQAPAQLPVALAEAGVVWTATWAALGLLGTGSASRRRSAAGILAALPLLATRRIALTERGDAVFPPTAFARSVARRDPEGRFRAVDASRYRPPSVFEREADAASPDGTAYYRRSWYFQTPTLWNRGTVFNADLDAGDLSRTESLRRLSSFAAADPSGGAFFASASLRFAIRYRDQAPLPGYFRFGGAGRQDWDENSSAEADVRLARRWKEAPGALAALDLLGGLSSGEIVLETGRSAAGESAAGAVKVLEKTPERMELDVDAPADGWLFVLRDYWTFRDVRLDGLPVLTVPAQLAFSALPVPAGRHRVAWRESVPGARFSWLGPAFFAAAGAGILARSRRRAA